MRVDRHLRQREIDVRSGLQKFPQHARQDIISRRSDESEIQCAADSFACTLGREDGLIRPRKDQTSAVEKDLPRWGDLNSSPVAEKQLHQQFLLERLNLAAQSRLGNAQASRGVSKMQLLRNGDKRA